MCMSIATFLTNILFLWNMQLIVTLLHLQGCSFQYWQKYQRMVRHCSVIFSIRAEIRGRKGKDFGDILITPNIPIWSFHLHCQTQWLQLCIQSTQSAALHCIELQRTTHTARTVLSDMASQTARNAKYRTSLTTHNCANTYAHIHTCKSTLLMSILVWI